MPRKPKFTRDEVIQSAFEVTREKGSDAITAVHVAANMGYTGSSLFTHFESMEELKHEVYLKAKDAFNTFVQDSLNYFPAFKELGMRWIRFARQEPHLYRLLFAGSPGSPVLDIPDEFRTVFDPIQREIEAMFQLAADDAREVITQCLTQANGLAGFIINGYGTVFTDEKVGCYLSNACLGMVLLIRSRQGTMTLDIAREMAMSTERMPVRKE